VSNNTDPKREHDYEIVLKPPEGTRTLANTASLNGSPFLFSSLQNHAKFETHTSREMRDQTTQNPRPAFDTPHHILFTEITT
jgi:hypothetical protein